MRINKYINKKTEVYFCIFCVFVLRISIKVTYKCTHSCFTKHWLTIVVEEYLLLLYQNDWVFVVVSFLSITNFSEFIFWRDVNIQLKWIIKVQGDKLKKIIKKIIRITIILHMCHYKKKNSEKIKKYISLETLTRSVASYVCAYIFCLFVSFA